MQALDSTQLLQINLWTLAIVVLLSCMAHREQWLARLLFGALTAALLVRYVAWRFADTLPDSRAGFATVWT